MDDGLKPQSGLCLHMSEISLK